MAKKTSTPDTQVPEELTKQLLELYLAPVPTIREFITHPYYLGNGIKACESQIRLLEQVFDPRQPINLAGLMMGIGWGKSFVVAASIAYMVYRTLCLRDPQEYYGLAPNSTITFVSFSVRASQAHQILFGVTKQLLESSPAFQPAPFNWDHRAKSQLRWPSRNVRVFAGTSRSSSAIGYNVLGAAIDEASWFQSDVTSITKAGSSENEYNDTVSTLAATISERMRSRGNARWRRDNLLLAISSPRTVFDWLVTYVAKRALTDDNVLFARQATWEGYPQLHLSGKTFEDEILGPVPIEYREDFATSPDRARRNLGAVPSQALKRFFANDYALARCYRGTAPDIFTVVDNKVVPNVAALRQLQRQYPRVAHIDLGHTRDKASVVVGHCDTRRHMIVIDGATYVSAEDFAIRTGTREIDFDEVCGLVEALTSYITVRMTSFDGWQSIGSRQQLRKKGIPTDRVSVDRDLVAYDTLLNIVNRGQLELSASPGRQRRFLEEAQFLELIAGVKVDHPPKHSKDVADGVASVVMQLAPLLSGSTRIGHIEREPIGVRQTDGRDAIGPALPWHVDRDNYFRKFER